MKPEKTTKKKNTERFVEECLLKRGDVYDYSNVVYVNNIKNKLLECL